MSIISRRRWMVAGMLGTALLAGSPAFAQHGGSGGHGGGAHASGGHGGGGHFGGGGGPHAVAHVGGGVHYAPSSGHFAAAGGHYAAGGVYGGHTAYGYPGGGYRHGYSTGAYWRGGYWRGGYWPRAFYGSGFAWFLPILPLAYATYWYDGVPYYYANDVYYTWNPDYSGYTATDPPPVTDSSGAGPQAATGAPPDASGPAGNAGPGPSAGAQIFMYPKNGQSEEQQSADKRECQQWAASQAGAQNSADYRRAMMACIEGRGYSAN